MFSKACTYGIRAALYLAAHASETHKVGVREIAEALGAPPHFLAKILQQMVRNHLVSSNKGPGGGFYLSEANRAIPLQQIVLTIDGPDPFKACILGLAECSNTHPCPLHVQAMAYRDGLHYQLRHQPVGELAARMLVENMRI